MFYRWLLVFFCNFLYVYNNNNIKYNELNIFAAFYLQMVTVLVFVIFFLYNIIINYLQMVLLADSYGVLFFCNFLNII